MSPQRKRTIRTNLFRRRLNHSIRNADPFTRASLLNDDSDQLRCHLYTSYMYNQDVRAAASPAAGSEPAQIEHGYWTIFFQDDDIRESEVGDIHHGLELFDRGVFCKNGEEERVFEEIYGVSVERAMEMCGRHLHSIGDEADSVLDAHAKLLILVHDSPYLQNLHHEDIGEWDMDFCRFTALLETSGTVRPFQRQPADDAVERQLRDACRELRRTQERLIDRAEVNMVIEESKARLRAQGVEFE